MPRCLWIKLCVLFVATAVMASAGAGQAGTVPAGAMPLTQQMPSQIPCGWRVNRGGLLVTGSDAFPDLCHCGPYCSRYAQPADLRRALAGPRKIRAYTFRPTSFAFPQRHTGSAMHLSWAARHPLRWRYCGRGCGHRSLHAGRVPTRGGPSQVPLPASNLLLGFSLVLLAAIALWRTAVAAAPNGPASRA